MIVGELLLGLRWILGVIFVTAGAVKLGSFESFEQSIASYGLIPRPLQRPIAKALPVLELCLGAACLLGILPAVAGWTASALLLSFAGAVTWNLIRGHRFACGCGTTHNTPISWRLALRDFALAVIAAAVALGPSGSLAILRGSSVLPPHSQTTAQLLPGPMIAILAFAMTRLLAANPFVWKSQHLTKPRHQPTGLAVVRVPGNATNPAKDR